MAEISPLRRRMIEDMTVRNLSPATQRSYLAAASKLSRYFDRSPDCLDLEDIRAFQVHLVAIGISWSALNQIVCGLRFFYDVTLGRTETLTGCPIERAYVDKGYRGHDAQNPRRVFISGQKRGVFGVIKHQA